MINVDADAFGPANGLAEGSGAFVELGGAEGGDDFGLGVIEAAKQRRAA